MDASKALFLWCSRLIVSFVSVVFDFNASPNDSAPVFPNLLSFVLVKLKKKCVVSGFRLCVVSFVFTTKIEFGECCVCLQSITQ